MDPKLNNEEHYSISDITLKPSLILVLCVRYLLLEVTLCSKNFPPKECSQKHSKCHLRESWIHSVHWGINSRPPPLSKTPPPLSCQAPSPRLKLTNCQSSPLFKQSLPLYWFFVNPPLKSDFSVNPQNIKVFHP